MITALANPRVIGLLATLLLLSSSASGAQVAPPSAANGTVRRVAIATHAIARGAVLTSDDFAYRDSTMRGIADTNQIAPGWVTRRVIAAGEVLRAPAIEPPMVITANQPVAVEWTDQNIRLTVRGIATRAASIGSRVSVRMESGRRVDATVVGAGRVRID